MLNCIENCPPDLRLV